MRERCIKSPSITRAFYKRPQSTLDTSNTSTNDISFVESNGDFCRDAELLEDSSRPLYAHQSELPLLPVPSLEETVDTFLPTALPFCKNDKERTSLLHAAERFPEQAAYLQERLLQRRDENKNTSWLQQWWSQLGYLQIRTSNAIHVSYFLPLRDDPSTSSMTARGAALLQTATLYYQDIQDGSLAPDRIRKRNGDSIFLCSAQYKYLFSSCRIPHVNQDSYRIYHQLLHPHYAVVAVRGQFYKIQLTDEQGKVLSRSVLESMLQELLEERPEEGSIPELGWLSATNRDTWAQTYEWLEHIPAMKAALEELQSGLCLLCLDVDSDNTSASPTSHLHDSQTALRFWHGNRKHSANRWFDKSMQLLVTANAHVAYQGEHSMADGMPVMSFCEVLVEKSVCANPEPADVVSKQQVPVHAEPIFAQALEQMSSQEIEKLSIRVHGAKQEFLDNIARHDMHKLYFTDYGSQQIRSSGYSPDAFVQMAMQLAGRRVFGTTVGTYESIQTRPFLHGRTETARTVSTASQAFCNAMLKHSNDVEMNRDLLHQAVDAHVAYTKKATEGHGIDRHFFGLGMLLEKGEKLPDLMQHPVFAESKSWRLSTSTVPGLAPGFGNVEKDGCGIGYDVLKDHCIFTVAAEWQTGYAGKMNDEIALALANMRVFL